MACEQNLSTSNIILLMLPDTSDQRHLCETVKVFIQRINFVFTQLLLLAVQHHDYDIKLYSLRVTD